MGLVDNGHKDNLVSKGVNAPVKKRRDAAATEWYRLYRPRRLKNVIGQPEAIATLQALLRDGLPSPILLTGPSGVGKTTIARALGDELGCGDADFFEVNCASMDEPMNRIREIERATKLAPRTGSCRLWNLEEVQALSRAGFAQQALLGVLENALSHVYFVLTTTDPQKLLPAIRTRCTTVALRALTGDELHQTISSVASKVDFTLSEEVSDRILECSSGSARQAVVLLQQVAGLKSDEERLAVLSPPTVEKAAFELVKMLVWQKPSWDKVRAFLVDLNEDPETLRRLILSNARVELLKPKGNHERAAAIIDICKEPWFDSAPARLAGACYEILRGT